MGKNDYDDVFNVCLCVSVSVCVSVVSLHFVSLMLLRVEWHAGTRNTVWPFVNVRVCTIILPSSILSIDWSLCVCVPKALACRHTLDASKRMHTKRMIPAVVG